MAVTSLLEAAKRLETFAQIYDICSEEYCSADFSLAAADKPEWLEAVDAATPGVNMAYVWGAVKSAEANVTDTFAIDSHTTLDKLEAGEAQGIPADLDIDFILAESALLGPILKTLAEQGFEDIAIANQSGNPEQYLTILASYKGYNVSWVLPKGAKVKLACQDFFQSMPRIKAFLDDAPIEVTNTSSIEYSLRPSEGEKRAYVHVTVPAPARKTGNPEFEENVGYYLKSQHLTPEVFDATTMAYAGANLSVLAAGGDGALQDHSYRYLGAGMVLICPATDRSIIDACQVYDPNAIELLSLDEISDRVKRKELTPKKALDYYAAHFENEAQFLNPSDYSELAETVALYATNYYSRKVSNDDAVKVLLVGLNADYRESNAVYDGVKNLAAIEGLGRLPDSSKALRYVVYAASNDSHTDLVGKAREQFKEFAWPLDDSKILQHVDVLVQLIGGSKAKAEVAIEAMIALGEIAKYAENGPGKEAAIAAVQGYNSYASNGVVPDCIDWKFESNWRNAVEEAAKKIYE